MEKNNKKIIPIRKEVHLMNYTIKQRINTKSIPPTIYEEGTPCIFIAERAGKYGVVKETGETLVAFEYDNISMAGFSLYLLVQKGKFGIAHIKGEGDIGEALDFSMKKIIPCEYDFIEFPTNGESFVILRKDQETGSEIWVYFCKTGDLKGPFCRENYCDRKYIVVCDDRTDFTEHVLYQDGRELFQTTENRKNLGIVGVFETRKGTVFLVLRDDDSAELILLEKRRKEEYAHCREHDEYYFEPGGKVKRYICEKFVAPVLYGQPVFGCERKCAGAFVVKSCEKHIVLDGGLEPVAQDLFEEMVLRYELIGFHDDGS